MLLPSLKKDADQVGQPFNEFEDLIPKIKAHIQDDLIISASSRMDLPSRFDSDSIDDERLNIGMNILFGRIQPELSFSIKGLHFLQPLEDLLPFLSGKNALAAKHKDVSPASPDVVRDQPLVTGRNPFHISSRKKIDRLFGRKLFESSAP
jgi:hypothetical protein